MVCRGRSSEKDASIWYQPKGERRVKVLMKVTSVAKVNDRLLVQLQGEYGNTSLNLPLSQQEFVRVDDEWTLEHSNVEATISVLNLQAKRAISLED